MLNPPEAREVPERTRGPACASCDGVQPAVLFPLEPLLQEAPRRQPSSQTSSGLEVGREMAGAPLWDIAYARRSRAALTFCAKQEHALRAETPRASGASFMHPAFGAPAVRWFRNTSPRSQSRRFGFCLAPGQVGAKPGSAYSVPPTEGASTPPTPSNFYPSEGFLGKGQEKLLQVVVGQTMQGRRRQAGTASLSRSVQSGKFLPGRARERWHPERRF